MGSLLRIIFALAVLLCSTNCWANSRTFFVKYACSAGEKPGSPHYQLLVLGDQYRVEKTTLALTGPNSQRIGYGTLNHDEQNKLAQLVPALAAAKVEEPKVAFLAGFCSWMIDVHGTSASASFYNVSKLGPEFMDFVQWILELKAQDRDGKQIRAVIPGEKAPDYP